MRVIHRFAFRIKDDEDQMKFQQAGLILSHDERWPQDGTFKVVEIAEDDPRWPQLLPLFKEKKATDVVTTEFSKSEIDSGRFLAMFATAHRGYPQPEKDFAYLSATYDVGEFCQKCGVGSRQRAPFHFKAEPRATGKTVLQLNWVFDEFFVAPEVWETLFAPFGVGSREVLIDRTGKRATTLVQLDVNTFSDVSVNGLEAMDCTVCGRRKYHIAGGRYCPSPLSISFPICKSNQLFGKSANPYRLVIVSHEVYSAITDAGLKDIEFRPCEELSAS